MSSPSSVRSILQSIRTTLLADTAVALLFAAIYSLYAEHLVWRHVVQAFLQAWIYANCIGLLANAVPWVSLAMCSWSRPVVWTIRALAMIAVAVIGSLAALGIFVLAGWVPRSEFSPVYWSNIRIAIIITIVLGIAIHRYETMRNRLEHTTLQLRDKELERERALKLATEAQLASLESRLHSHFLFNTLNSILSLIPEDPQRAERLVQQMAELLRFSLETAQKGAVPLEREMQIVNDYLEIEKTRLGARLTYTIEVQPDLNGASVPPLAIQTLVENSIKHVVAPARAGGSVEVNATRAGGALQVTVRDTGPGFELDAAPAGHGVDNLRRRLSALYGPAAHIRTLRNRSGGAVQLAIPLEA